MKAAKTFLFILVIIGMLWLMFVLLGRAFRGNKTPETSTQKTLVSYANTDAKVSMYVDGPVKSDQEHEAWKITIDRTSTTVEFIKGYENNVVRQQTYPNNVNSFATLLESLDKAQFDAPNSVKYPQDERGYCPTRNRYVYDMQNGSEQISHAWWTSCGSGTFMGNKSITHQLFLNQVPRKEFAEIRRGTTVVP